MDLENPNEAPVVETKTIDVVTNDETEEKINDSCERYTRYTISFLAICVILVPLIHSLYVFFSF